MKVVLNVSELRTAIAEYISRRELGPKGGQAKILLFSTPSGDGLHVDIWAEIEVPPLPPKQPVEPKSKTDIERLKDDDVL